MGQNSTGDFDSIKHFEKHFSVKNVLCAYYSFSIFGDISKRRPLEMTFSHNNNNKIKYKKLGGRLIILTRNYELNCEGRGFHVIEKLAFKVAFDCHINPLLPRSTAKIEKCLILFPEGGKSDGLENPRGTAEN